MKKLVKVCLCLMAVLLLVMPWEAVAEKKVMFTVGILLCLNFVNAYIGAGYTVFNDMMGTNHMALIGLVAIVLSFIAFVSTLMLHAIAANMPGSGGSDHRK